MSGKRTSFSGTPLKMKLMPVATVLEV